MNLSRKSPSREPTPGAVPDGILIRLFHIIDDRCWERLADIFADEIIYIRPGYAPISGLAELARFYREVRIIASGRHRVESQLVDHEQGFCWGSFEGVSRDGRPLSVEFADWYRFTQGKVIYRRTFFHLPAV